MVWASSQLRGSAVAVQRSQNREHYAGSAAQSWAGAKGPVGSRALPVRPKIAVHLIPSTPPRQLCISIALVLHAPPFSAPDNPPRREHSGQPLCEWWWVEKKINPQCCQPWGALLAVCHVSLPATAPLWWGLSLPWHGSPLTALIFLLWHRVWHRNTTACCWDTKEEKAQTKVPQITHLNPRQTPSWPFAEFNMPALRQL